MGSSRSMQDNSRKDSRDGSLAEPRRTQRKALHRERNKNRRHLLAILVSRYLCGLSECNERAREKAYDSRKDAKIAKESVNRQREKGVWDSRIRAFLGDLGGLSECNERAREKFMPLAKT
jgi:hypothetical protein